MEFKNKNIFISFSSFSIKIDKNLNIFSNNISAALFLANVNFTSILIFLNKYNKRFKIRKASLTIEKIFYSFLSFSFSSFNFLIFLILLFVVAIILYYLVFFGLLILK